MLLEKIIDELIKLWGRLPKEQKRKFLPAIICILFLILMYFVSPNKEILLNYIYDKWFSIPSAIAILVTLFYYEINLIKKGLKQFVHIPMIISIIGTSFLLFYIISGYVEGFRPNYYSNKIRIIWIGGNPTKLEEKGDKEVKAIDGGLMSPQGLEMGREDTLYVADWESHHIYQIYGFINQNIHQIFVDFLTKGKAGYKDGDLRSSEFTSPSDLAFDSDYEYLYVADYGNGAIRRIDLKNKEVRTLISYELDTKIQDTCLYDLTDTNIDQNNNDVKFCENVKLVYERPDEYILESGYMTGVTLDSPAGIYLDGNTLYIADEGYHAIHRIVIEEIGSDVEGNKKYRARFKTIVGDGIAGWSKPDRGKPESICIENARLQLPTDVLVVTTEKDKWLYIVDTWNNSIRRIKLDKYGNFLRDHSGDSILKIYAGTGEKGFKDGGVDEAMFNKPGNIIKLNDDSFIISDTENDMIRIIKNNQVRTLVGTGRPGLDIPVSDFQKGNTRSRGPRSRLNSPWGLVRCNNALIVADSGNHLIWQVILEESK